MPYLDPQIFPAQDIEAVKPRAGDTTPLAEGDIAKARKGAVALAIETAAQIAEAQAPRNPAVREELESLESVLSLVRRGNGFVIQVEAQNPQDIVISAREALARRQKVPLEQIKLTDDELIKWSNDNFRLAGQRIGRSVNAIKEYLRR